ncbi:MAG TPA: deoxyribonuclease V [Alphaproteobacteria bacterium]
MMQEIPQPKNASEALSIQQAMRGRVQVTHDDFDKIERIAGIDVGYDPVRNVSKAALVLLDIENLKPIVSITAEDPTPFPYIPGLLSFREAPVIIRALEQLKEIPDILFIDGQGIAHPRRLGVAAHMGVLTGLPSIGIAKSLLCGNYKEPGPLKGSKSTLTHKGEIIGTVLRSKEKCKPLFISPGHRITLDTAVDLVERCLTRYRLPEPTRLADKLSKIDKTLL